MTTEWRNLPTMADVAAAQAAGDEIEVRRLGEFDYTEWSGTAWAMAWSFRARPRQPKMKKVKSLCYRSTVSGELTWRKEELPIINWKRFPAGDIEGEVEDDN